LYEAPALDLPSTRVEAALSKHLPRYNFGIQTPGPGVADLKLDEKPVMLISHALGEGKKIDSNLVRGGGNHARAHPLYSGWNVMAQLSLRLCQGTGRRPSGRSWTEPPSTRVEGALSLRASRTAVPVRARPAPRGRFP